MDVYPLVSVIIPSRDRKDFVLLAINSVLSQIYKNIEIIVVDDGSQTPLAPLLAKVFGEHVRCVRHDCSKGAPIARNTGAKYAIGEYIAFLDDDDVWLSDKIEKQMSSFLKLEEDFGVVYCGYDFIVDGVTIPRDNIYHDEFDLALIALRGCPVGSPTPIIRKYYFEAVNGFDANLSACQDWDLWIRLAQVCKFYPVKKSLALYRVHGEQISTDISNKIIAREALIDKHLEALLQHPVVLSSHFRRLGVLCALDDRCRDARLFLLKSIRQNWKNWGSWAHLFLECFYRRLDKYLIEKYGIKKIGNVRIIN